MTSRAAVAVWWFLPVTYPAWLVFGINGWFSTPHIGVHAEPDTTGRMVITEMFPGGAAWGAGASVGDILLQLDGVQVDERAWIARGDSGTEFRILTTPEGVVLIDSTERGRAAAVPVMVTLAIISLVFAVTGFFIFFRATHSPEVSVVSVLFLVSAIAFAVAPAGIRSQLWALVVARLSFPWSAALFFVFFSLLRYPPQDNRSIAGYLRWGMGFWALALNIFYLVGIVVVSDIHVGVRQVQSAQNAVGLLAGLALLVASYVDNDSPVVKEQLRIMAFGITAAVLPFVVLSILPIAMVQDAFLSGEVTILAVIVVPLSFGYGILRHQLMEIRRLVHRGASYALISISIFVIYGALIAALRSTGGTELSGNQTVQILLLAVLFGAVPFISGTRRLAFAAVDRLLYREYVNHPDLTRRVSMNAAFSQQTDELSQTVVATIADELRLSFAALIGAFDGRPVVKASVGEVPDEFIRDIGSEVAHDGEKPMSLRFSSLQDGNGEALVVKLTREPRGAWFLALGPKITEEPFRRENLDLAQSVASNVVTMVEKVELLDELKAKASELRELNKRLVTTQEAEKARIASYLHEEPLRQISDLVWRYSGSELPSEVQNEIHQIAEGLRNFSVRLHPTILGDLGLVRALEWLGTESTAAADCELHIEPGNVGRNDRLDYDTELALYRIAQEALVNCKRHSKAKNVWLRLHREDDEISISVEDDGVGILSPDVREPNRRLGIVGMRERAEQSGGNLTISARSPSGTVVSATLPVGASPNHVQEEIESLS